MLKEVRKFLAAKEARKPPKKARTAAWPGHPSLRGAKSKRRLLQKSEGGIFPN